MTAQPAPACAPAPSDAVASRPAAAAPAAWASWEDLLAAVAAQPGDPSTALIRNPATGQVLAAADAIEASAEPLAQILIREQGKPLNGPSARFEVGACSAWLRVTCSHDVSPTTIVDDGQTRATLSYKPIGVVAAIGPWNWPMMITIW